MSNFIGINSEGAYVTPKTSSILPSITNKMLMQVTLHFPHIHPLLNRCRHPCRFWQSLSHAHNHPVCPFSLPGTVGSMCKSGRLSGTRCALRVLTAALTVVAAAWQRLWPSCQKV